MSILKIFFHLLADCSQTNEQTGPLITTLVLQVPVCPLCSQPIPVTRGSVPDLAVSQHIENNCQTRAKARVFTNKCHKDRCKKKELVACICDVCKLNFCLAHRHPADHSCQGPQAARDRAAAAASARATSHTSASSGGQSGISNFFSGPFRQAGSGGQVGQSRGQVSASAAAALNRQEGRGVTPGGLWWRGQLTGA